MKNIQNSLSVDLSHLNSMALKCLAKQHICLTHIDEIEPLFRSLQKNKQNFVILSGGSNILLPEILDAVVISPTLLGKNIVFEDNNIIDIEVMAGENWHQFVVESTIKGWFGLENLALIPGWVGTCPVQNIGAYGVQVEDIITKVTAFHIPTCTWNELSVQDCHFSYRDSIFKQQAGQWLITKVQFSLSKVANIQIKYGDVAKIAQQFAENNNRKQPTSIDVMNAIIQIRQSKLPNPEILPNCGSFFKNPIISKNMTEALLTQYPTLVYYPISENQTKLAAGWLIEQAGLKGRGIAPIFTHVHQALVLTNHSPLIATQQDVQRAMQYIIDNVKQKFGVILEPEPVWIRENGQIEIGRADKNG